MKLDQMFPSAYIKASDIGDKKPVVVIESIKMQVLGQGEEQETKPVLSFVGKEKQMVLNKTNANTIAGMYGTDTKDWINKKVRIVVAEVAYKGKMGPALRISSVKPEDTEVHEELPSESENPF